MGNANKMMIDKLYNENVFWFHSDSGHPSEDGPIDASLQSWRAPLPLRVAAGGGRHPAPTARSDGVGVPARGTRKRDAAPMSAPPLRRTHGPRILSAPMRLPARGADALGGRLHLPDTVHAAVR